MIHLASRTVRRVGIVIASCVMMMSAHAATKDLMEIKVGIQTTPPDEVYRVKDWGAKYNLKVSEGSYSSGAEILKAFIAGQIDIGNGGSGRCGGASPGVHAPATEPRPAARRGRRPR